MLRKTRSGTAIRSRLMPVIQSVAEQAVDRRTFLTRSGLAAGGLAAIGALSAGTVRRAEAATAR